MRSLRSLCLLKVHSLSLPTLDLGLLPPSLAKDIKIMRLCNKSFMNRDDYFDGFTVYQHALSIQFDGTSWTIQYRSNNFLITECCPHCDFVQPDLQQFTLEDRKLSPVPVQINSEQFYKGPKEVLITLSFTMKEDDTSGEIKIQFFQDGGPILSRDNPTITILMNAERQWVAECDGFYRVADIGGRYIETPDPIQDVFSTPLHHSCIGTVMDWLNGDPDTSGDFFFGLDDVISAIDDDIYNQQETEEFLEDFWKLVLWE
eukprot:GFUD01027021.1.p1 GENE.GFUD01027021.1~~GFUD01027021.1.p1  ORF type:complete len:259 (+),score=33.40 GFUD01027021.1:57-833(+)